MTRDKTQSTGAAGAEDKIDKIAQRMPTTTDANE